MYFNLNLEIKRRWPKSKISGFCWDRSISENKNVCVQLEAPWTTYSNYCFQFINITYSFCTKRDHAGLEINLGLLGFHFLFEFYDKRHWFDEEDRWFKPGEEARVYGYK